MPFISSGKNWQSNGPSGCLGRKTIPGHSAFVAGPPDMHVFRLGNEPVPKIRVGYRNNLFRPLPGGSPLQVDQAILGNQVLDVGPGSRNHPARRDVREDPAFPFPVPAPESGGTADKAFPAPGKVSPQYKIKLAARPADVADTGRK